MIPAPQIPAKQNQTPFDVWFCSGCYQAAILFTMLFYEFASFLSNRVVLGSIKAVKKVFFWHVLLVIQIHEVIAEYLLCIDYCIVCISHGIDKAIIWICIDC